MQHSFYLEVLHIACEGTPTRLTRAEAAHQHICPHRNNGLIAAMHKDPFVLYLRPIKGCLKCFTEILSFRISFLEEKGFKIEGIDGFCLGQKLL
jgi:hypothetical protein